MDSLFIDLFFLHSLRMDYNESVSGMEHLLAARTQPSQLLFFGELHGSTKNFVNKMDELTCYLPGTLALGVHYGMPRHHLDLAQDLIYTCVQTWLRQPTHLAAEISYFNTQVRERESTINQTIVAYSSVLKWRWIRLNTEQLWRDSCQMYRWYSVVKL